MAATAGETTGPRLVLEPGELAHVERPTFLVDRERVERNLEAMQARARAAGARLRPHVKTHRSLAVGRWLRERGIDAVAVSSLEMAAYFAGDGWRDVTVAIPFNPRERARALDLARRIRLGVTVDSAAAVAALAGPPPVPAGVWIEIDTGPGRSGVPAGSPERVLDLAGRIAAAGLRPVGLLAHEGRTYRAGSVAEIRSLHAAAVAALEDLRGRLAAAGHPVVVSLGDTPACSLVEDLSGPDELRPGNFVFYDLMQLRLGACRGEDLAAAVACPVIGRYPERGLIVLHGGSVHLGSEAVPGPGGEPCHGLLARWDGRRWLGPDPAAPVVSLSQEHGVVSLPPADLERARIGGLALVLPVHACLAADRHRGYLDLAARPLDAM